jgi:hypothetical protein
MNAGRKTCSAIARPVPENTDAPSAGGETMMTGLRIAHARPGGGESLAAG